MIFRVARAVVAIPLALALGVLSLPWVAVGIGAMALGDFELADKANASSPLWRFLEWRDA